MTFKYSQKITSVETLMELETKQSEAKVRLSELRGRGSLVLYDLRIYHDGKPSSSGIFLSEAYMRRVLLFMNNYLNVRQDAPDIVDQLGYDPFQES